MYAVKVQQLRAIWYQFTSKSLSVKKLEIKSYKSYIQICRCSRMGVKMPYSNTKRRSRHWGLSNFNFSFVLRHRLLWNCNIKLYFLTFSIFIKSSSEWEQNNFSRRKFDQNNLAIGWLPNLSAWTQKRLKIFKFC